MNDIVDVIRDTYVDISNAFVQVMLQFGVPVDMVPMHPGQVALLSTVSQWGLLLVGIFFKSLDKIVNATIRI